MILKDFYCGRNDENNCTRNESYSTAVLSLLDYVRSYPVLLPCPLYHNIIPLKFLLFYYTSKLWVMIINFCGYRTTTCTKLIDNNRFTVNTYSPHRSLLFLASILQHHTYDKQVLLIPLLASLELYKRPNNL